jgi:hypothetical protein
MKKFSIVLIVTLFFGIVYCFYTDRFMTAYDLIFILISVLAIIGHIYAIDNSIYLRKKQSNDHQNRYGKYWD